MNKSVSVCIPAFNSLELFKRCLDSVTKQDLRDVEIIVSDDSTNNEIENYINDLKLPNLLYFHNSVPLGSPENWNNAVSKASGKYIKILHHDDYFTDNTGLRKFVSALENDSSVSFVFSQTKIHYKSDNSIFIHKQTSGQLKRMQKEIEFLFFRNVIGAPSAVCFRNNRSVLFNKKYKWLVDVDFYIRFLKKHPKSVCIQEPLITVVAGEEGQVTAEITKSKERIISENLNLFSSLYSEKLNRKKSLLFFQELFSGYKVHSFGELQTQFTIPSNIFNFMKEVFSDLPKANLFKKIKKRLLTSRYNKQIFKIERF